MRLILFHPGLLARPCGECQKWMYRDDHDRPICTSEKLLRGRPAEPVPRSAGTPTPCYRCPKKNPQEAAGVERDLPRAKAAVELYYQVQGTAGVCLSAEDASDPIIARNLGIVQEIIEEKQTHDLAAVIAATQPDT